MDEGRERSGRDSVIGRHLSKRSYSSKRSNWAKRSINHQIEYSRDVNMNKNQRPRCFDVVATMNCFTLLYPLSMT